MMDCCQSGVSLSVARKRTFMSNDAKPSFRPIHSIAQIRFSENIRLRQTCTSKVVIPSSRTLNIQDTVSLSKASMHVHNIDTIFHLIVPFSEIKGFLGGIGSMQMDAKSWSGDSTSIIVCLLTLSTHSLLIHHSSKWKLLDPALN